MKPIQKNRETNKKTRKTNPKLQTKNRTIKTSVSKQPSCVNNGSMYNKVKKSME